MKRFKKRVILVSIVVMVIVSLFVYSYMRKRAVIEDILFIDLLPSAEITQFKPLGKISINIWTQPGIYYRSLYAKIEGDESFYNDAAYRLEKGAVIEEVVDPNLIQKHLEENGVNIIDEEQAGYMHMVLYVKHYFTFDSYDILLLQDSEGKTVMHIIACDPKNWKIIWEE